MNLLEIVPEIKPYLQKVEESLQQTVSSNARIMDSITHYIMGSPGKRLRPALFIISADPLGFEESVIETAASIELIHTASLVHDDIVVKSTLRRGIPTVNACWGNEISVLTGDYLFARAFMLLTRAGSHQIIDIFASIIERMSIGEIEQLSDGFNVNLTEKTYMDRITKKTAHFMAGVCKAGGVVRKAGEEELQALYNYGLNLGLAFQLKDDILDFKGEEEKTGKPLGGDLRQGVITLPLIHLIRHSPKGSRIKEFIGRGEITESPLDWMAREMEELGSLDYCENLVKEYGERALEALASLEGAVKERLRLLVQANSGRDF